jgi:hypothetical protein
MPTTLEEYKLRLIGSQYGGKKIVDVDCESLKDICDLWLEDFKRVSFSSIQRAVEFVTVEELTRIAES